MTNAIINALFITGGVLFLALALFHAMFWRLFNWSSQLEKLHPVNKGAMQAMNVALIMVFLFFAMVSFCLQLDLIHSKLGMYTLGFISVFCLVRSIVQWPFFHI